MNEEDDGSDDYPYGGQRDDDDDPVGDQGDYECTRNFSARIEADGRSVGTLQATLIDRPGPFHAACDAESAELQEFGCVLFGSNGQVQKTYIYI